MRKYLIPLLLISGLAVGAAIKTWSAGEPLSYTDLNTVLAHIHGSLRGGTHTLITDSDVNTSASFAATNTVRAWAKVGQSGAECVAGVCTLTGSKNVTSVTRAALGQYTVILNETWTLDDINYAVVVSSNGDDRICNTVGPLNSVPNHFSVYCYVVSARAAIDAVFSFTVLDDG